MAQQYGLGRGLASLIPPKKTGGTPTGVVPAEAVPPGKKAPGPFVMKSDPLGIPPAQPQVLAKPLAPARGATPSTPVAAGVEKTPVAAESGAGKAPEDEERPRPGEAVVAVAVGSIIPNPEQPRVQFDAARLAELAKSIQEHGVLQPLIVTKNGNQYELIAGERRLQAAKIAGLPSVPVIVREADSRVKLELAIIENVQRHDLNPIEEARAYLRLTEEFGLHQEAVAEKVGKSRSAVANTVRLLHLPAEIQRAIIDEKVSEGHARALLMIENPDKQRALFELIVKNGLTVRETELQARAASAKPRPLRPETLDPGVVARMEQLRERLGTKVKLSPSGKGGRLVIEFYSSEELEALFQKFGI